MKTIRTALEELYGLFVEDSSLAVGIVVWLVATIWVLPHLPIGANYRPPLFFGGLCALLLENVYRSARRHRDLKKAA